MIKISLYALLCFCFTSLTATSTYANSIEKICIEKSDKLYCENGVIDHITYFGDVIFHGTTVTGVTKILGDVSADHANFNTLDVTGDFNAVNTNINGCASIIGDVNSDQLIFNEKTTINGDLEATQIKFLGATEITGDIHISNGSFGNDLALSSFKSTFIHSTTKNIEYSPTSKQQITYLDNSVVNGNIKFSSDHGTVISRNGSVIYGTVVGGKLINQ